MSFWKTSGLKYEQLTEIDEAALLTLVNGMSRRDLIEWLCWNDRNGIYSDEQSVKEFGAVMTRSEGIEILLRQVEENRTVQR